MRSIKEGESTNQQALYHHGIKGMKWGIRRFQKKNGQLTASGKKRYNDSPDKAKAKKKSNRQEWLEKQYRQQGLSKADAEKAATKRVKAEKIIAVSAGVTVAACAAYIAYKARKERVDSVIKSGQKLQRVEGQNVGNKLHDMFYASQGKHDNARYEGMLGGTRFKQTGEAYLMQLQANKDIRVASNKRAADVFGELYKNDPDFKNAVRENVSKHFSGANKIANIDDTSPKNIKKMYENFNSGLIDIRNSGSGADKKFYNKLKESGYGAIQDINDKKYSGYRAKNPMIIFDNSNKNVMVKTVSALNKDDTLNKRNKEMAKAFVVEPFLAAAGPMSAAGLTYAAVNTYNEVPYEGDRYSEKVNRRR